MLDVVGHELRNGRTRLYEVVLRQELIASLVVFVVTIALFFGYGAFLRLQVGSALYPPTLAAIFVLCLASSGVTYASVPEPIVTLCRGLAIATGFYSVTLFPGIPTVHDVFYGRSQQIIQLAWVVAGLASVLALWRPSWLIYCAFYIFWIKKAASYITGLEFHPLMDVQPLYQVPAYLGIAIIAPQLIRRTKIGNVVHLTPTLRPYALDPWVLVLITAIALHAANYFNSGVAKASLNGGIADWALHNDNGNLLLVALYNKQLLWGESQAPQSAALELMNFIGRPLAIAILLGQLAAIVAFSNRTLLIVLFTFYDLMHIGIFLLGGINFGRGSC